MLFAQEDELPKKSAQLAQFKPELNISNHSSGMYEENDLTLPEDEEHYFSKTCRQGVLSNF